MKKMIIALVAMVMTASIASAQNYMVIDSEKVFKSVEAYNNALEQIEKLATEYQAAVDNKFAEVESLYNTYMQQRASLSQNSQQQFTSTVPRSSSSCTILEEKVYLR